MKNRILLLLLMMGLFSSCGTKEKIYNPICGDGYYILTPKVGNEPRINGPGVYGVRPKSEFMYSIPVTGRKPINIEVANLPDGLAYDKEKNIISGFINDTLHRTHTIKLKAVNSYGSAERKLDIIVGDEIALTPPMGWSSWINCKKKVNQSDVLRQAKALKSVGLDRYGYSYINIDDGWQGNIRGGKYNAIMPDKVKFPDMMSLSDSIHDMGLKFGIYSTPWISSYAGFIGGSSNNESGYWDKSMLINFKKKKIEGMASRHGKFKMDVNDAKQWAEWRIDYMKYDWNPNDSASIVSMSKALKETGRDIVFSISNSCPLTEAERCKKYVQVFRTGGDIRARWSKDREHMNLLENWKNHNKWLSEGYEGGPGHTPDADFLMVGLQKYGSNDSLTVDELYHHVSSFMLWGTPLLLSCELQNLNDFELSLLTNVELLDVNQDKLSKPAKHYIHSDGIELLVKDLSDGNKALGIFNFKDEEVLADICWDEIGISGKKLLRDLWRQQDIGTYEDNFKSMVRPHGCVVVKIITSPK